MSSTSKNKRVIAARSGPGHDDSDGNDGVSRAASFSDMPDTACVAADAASADGHHRWSGCGLRLPKIEPITELTRVSTITMITAGKKPST